MTAPIRIAVIGLGKIAHDQHLPAIARSHQFDLVATVDRAGVSEGPTPFFPSIEALIASGIAVDAVAICTPPQVRHDIAQTALEQGWHVLLEKPPGATIAEVVALREAAQERKVTLFTAWHSRFAPAVEAAGAWLKGREMTRAKITWREDVRIWHPGQDWIWAPGGFGVFDPGINGLSIATSILPSPMFVVSSQLSFPANLCAPIAAQVSCRDRSGAPIELDFDFLQEGPQHWDIEVETTSGTLVLSKGGAELSVSEGALGEHDTRGEDLVGEYPGLYRRFAALVRAGVSEVDVSPMRLVADAFLRARIVQVEEFHE
ncbi:gfo/Idh/MocA family oxidoreductase [Aurantiacibacter xanthus]|uniref:Gfo/Idh/MocA family oxidoreductase n=1 Tax=Aurantiacibacter xanthus TaxID=1784712 RepID=A0A3A1P0Q9_9SPHN|nr:Gfo/Idh/MocA family oxidoreductase [Aurantiacibacter xanthus]RIV82354.1 gfo/Idh/MocA family oxidoreductase [Aurantiacibacter xanthus]